MSERRLATVRAIAEIKPIEGADKICAYRVDGWWVVDLIGKYSVGEFVVYAEPDSWIPHSLAPFLSKGKEPREFNGVKGERLRTVKLRGQLSQGLLLPVPPNIDWNHGAGLDEFLGIQKWERPVSAQLQGMARGNFPSFLRKTDQERIQNIPEVFTSASMDHFFEVSLKLDGSSMTVWFQPEEWGVCSRNLDLKLDQEGNTFVDTAKRIFLHERFDNLREFGGIAIQGELMGPGIQGNRENLKSHEFFVFDIWDIENQVYWAPSMVVDWCEAFSINHVPVLGFDLLREHATSIDDLLACADAIESLNHPIAEGVVFKRDDGQFSFKAISNKFLLTEK